MKFEKAKWIWLNKEAKKDEYAVFLCDFNIDCGNTFLNISADSNYQVYVNGKLSAFGQYPDYPHYKVYDSCDISKFVNKGKNRLVIVAWYYGNPTLTYTVGKAGVIFEVVNGGKVIEYSSENIVSRLALDNVSHVEKIITPQIGYSFVYNPNLYDGYLNADYIPNGFEPSKIVESSTEFVKRPIKELVATDFVSAKRIESDYDIYKKAVK